MRSIIASIALLATLAFGVVASAQELPKGNVNFLVVSDLGAFGGGDQPEVAATLGRVAETFSPTAILNMGDTFHFWGVESVDDPGWVSNFESIYTAPFLHSLWYCALGNHDYQGNTQALVDYTHKSRRWNMPERYYSKTFSRRGTSVEVIFLDTTPFLQRAQTQPDIYPDAGRQDTAAQTAWLAKALASSTADWVIVAAHHPVYSSRPDNSRQRADIQAHIAPVLAKHRPDAYISGDVHCFEHFAFPDDPTDYFTCTAGSVAYPVDAPDPRTLFTSGSSGFMTLSADAEKLSIAMLDKEGRVLYTYTKTKH
ncbi:MAG: metallophosphoesterase [Muribaculaceae bacterium]|nr:metallophosphoesterase [Muribaculaceae bacterium]